MAVIEVVIVPVFQPIFGKGLWAASWPVKCHRAPRPNFRASGGGPPVLVRAAAAPMTSDYVIDSDDEAPASRPSKIAELKARLGLKRAQLAARARAPPTPSSALLRGAAARAAAAAVAAVGDSTDDDEPPAAGVEGL